MCIRQHYTEKANNPTEIFRSSQTAGVDYKDFILNTAGANIPNGLNFTNDGFGCVFVYGDGANSYTTVVSMSTAYALDTMFKSSSITNFNSGFNSSKQQPLGIIHNYVIHLCLEMMDHFGQMIKWY